MAGTGWKNFDTLESFIFKEQQKYQNSRGAFSHVLRRIGVASKIIAAKVRRAGLNDLLEPIQTVNPHGEVQKKLDDIANQVMRSALSWMPQVAGLASEEEKEYSRFPRLPNYEGTRYIVLYDPLDGSSNIDANVSMGTIFSIFRCKSNDDLCSLSDFLRPGRELEAAGYIIYGPSTMLVYTTGKGVHAFTLDPEVGEFVLSHENITIPKSCTCMSTNECNISKWPSRAHPYAQLLRTMNPALTSRYIGSLVSDIHRNLLYGGIFMYPEDEAHPQGKLRLLYECAPLAFIVEQAGGLATTGKQRILDITPTNVHQHAPLVIGNRDEVLLYEKLFQQDEKQVVMEV